MERYVTAPNGANVVNTVVVTYPHGRDLAFGRNNDNTYSSPAGRTSHFSALPGGGYRVAEKDGTTYEFGHLLSSGRFALSAVKDLGDRALKLTHTGGRLTQIKAASERSLTLAWSATNPAHVVSVSTDPAVPGDATSVNTWTYEYSGSTLTRVCPPTSRNECHTYDYSIGPIYQTAVGNARPHSYWG